MRFEYLNARNWFDFFADDLYGAHVSVLWRSFISLDLSPREGFISNYFIQIQLQLITFIILKNVKIVIIISKKNR